MVMSLNNHKGMLMRINEDSIIQAAREWAVRSNKNGEVVASSAMEVINALKAKLTGVEYDQALERLYREYDES